MRPIRHNPMSTMALVVVISGLMGLLFHSFLLAQDFPADITRGKGVYQRNCQNCHGAGGRGDGPDGKTLKVAPANFHQIGRAHV